MHKTPALLLAVPAVIAFAAPAPVLAQEDVDDAVAYAGWRAAFDAGDTAKAVKLAGEYMSKFPKGKYADYLGKWLAQNGPAQKTPLQAAFEAKDTKKIAELGRAHMKANPQDVATAIQLAWNVRPDIKLATDIDSFSRQAIKLLEAGTLPKGDSFDKNQTLAWLHQNLGMVAAAQKKVDVALKEYASSSSLAPKNAGIVGSNLRACGRLHSTKLNAAVAKYSELQGAGAAEAELTAATGAISAAADDVIDCWGRLMALAQDNPDVASLTKGIDQALAGVYAQRHPEDPDGLDALIQSFRK
jgi:tetratricopeptide (TPR) repeat protein